MLIRRPDSAPCFAPDHLNTVRYGYDADGRPTTTTYPSGKRTRAEYNTRERAEYGYMQFPGFT